MQQLICRPHASRQPCTCPRSCRCAQPSTCGVNMRRWVQSSNLTVATCSSSDSIHLMRLLHAMPVNITPFKCFPVALEQTARAAYAGGLVIHTTLFFFSLSVTCICKINCYNRCWGCNTQELCKTLCGGSSHASMTCCFATAYAPAGLRHILHDRQSHARHCCNATP